ncbi:MAG: alpha/beta fold hydrolase [Dehalococcoidia bacterium]
MRVQVNGTTLNYDEQGAGRALLLIHGIGGSGQDWSPVIPAFAATARVVAVDVRGFGLSDKPPGPYNARLWADDLAALWLKLELGRGFVLGHSMGGVIAQRLVLDHPEVLLGAMLMSTSSMVKEAASVNWERQADEIERDGLGPMTERRQAGYTDEFRREHPEALAADERRLRLNEPHAYAAAARAVARYNFTDELASVRMPVLIIQGLDDKQTPPGGSVILSRTLPGSRLEMLEHCGHNVYTDQPQRLIDLVSGFVRDVTSAADTE